MDDIKSTADRILFIETLKKEKYQELLLQCLPHLPSDIKARVERSLNPEFWTWENIRERV